MKDAIEVVKGVVTIFATLGFVTLLCSVPNWMTVKERTPAGGARTDLKGAYQALKSFYAENDRYSSDFTTMGFSPERGNTFAYVYSGGEIQRRETERLRSGRWGIVGVDQYEHPDIDTDALLAKLPAVLPSGLAPGVESRGAVVVAIGDPDRDGVPFIMSVATFDRPAAKAGEPFVEQAD